MNRAKSKSRKTCPIRNPVRSDRQGIYLFNDVVATGFLLELTIHASLNSKIDFRIGDSRQRSVVANLAALHCVPARFAGECSAKVNSVVAATW